MVSRRQRRLRASENTANRTSNAIVRRARVPRVMSQGPTTIVRGSEGIGQLGLGSAFQFSVVDLSPMAPASAGVYSLEATWLGRQATLYNRYRYLRCTLRYVPFVSTSTSGRVAFAYTGDTNDIAPTSVQTMTQYQNSVEAPVWREVTCNFQPTSQREFVVTSITGANSQGLPPAPGNFLVGTDSGAGSSQSVGSLYLDYEVEFWSRAAFADNN